MELRKNLFCYIMVAPALLITLALGIIPMITSLWWSFLDYDLIRAQSAGKEFVGWRNYQVVLSDQRFVTSLVNTVVITFIVMVSVVALGLLLAHVMNATFRGRAIVRTLICAPWFVPPVVAAAIWVWLLNTDRSPINALLMNWGLIDSNLRFLTDTSSTGPLSLPLASVVAVRVWNGLPFVVIFLLAGMQSISRSLYEAASIDGATLIGRFRFITLPLLKPVLGVIVMLLMITGFGHFEINFIMTGGGPRDMTNVGAVYAYQQAFNFFRFDYASAASGVVLLMTSAICIFYIRAQVKKDK